MSADLNQLTQMAYGHAAKMTRGADFPLWADLGEETRSAWRLAVGITLGLEEDPMPPAPPPVDDREPDADEEGY